jgi:uncharacterized protein YjbI with pentapeptide repeats
MPRKKPNQPKDKKPHLNLLKRSVEEWNAFRNANPEVKPNLTGANLSYAHLTRANLSDANLTDAHLAYADLSDANLTDAHLAYADLSDANLTDADLTDANLTDADLTDAHLTRANLTDADLTDAYLTGAYLTDADLTDAYLTGAYLTRANLTGAYLAGADLTGADLTGAYLTGAYLVATVLNRADLSGTNLSGASFSHTILADMDLRQTKGLDSVEHVRPSTIGIDTIYRSGGEIPEVFLRGCGVPDDFITYARSLVGKAFDFYSCFISYSHADRAFARRLHDALQGRGIRCWLDEHQLLPGQKIYDEVDRGIRLWDKVLLCASKHSLTSWWVEAEIEKAFVKERQVLKDRGESVLTLIPLDLDGYLFRGWQSGKASVVKERVAPDFTGWKRNHDKFEKQLERVIRALKTDGGRETAPDPKL